MPFLDNELNTILENGTHELQSHLDLGIHSEEQAVKLLSAMTDSVEVIKWYLFFMDAKLNRAFLGKRENDKIEEDYQSDSNGSAKIALLAIDRSMGAWAKILSLLPNTEDVSLKSLALLSKIKELASKEFPDASKFIRPGFDDKIK